MSSRQKLSTCTTVYEPPPPNTRTETREEARHFGKKVETFVVDEKLRRFEERGEERDLDGVGARRVDVTLPSRRAAVRHTVLLRLRFLKHQQLSET